MHPTITYRRREDVEMREVGEEIFLIDSRNGGIHRLNATGAALWRLIATPMPLSAIVKIFGEAFPERSRRKLKKMIQRLLEGLDDSDLLVAQKRVEGGSPDGSVS